MRAHVLQHVPFEGLGSIGSWLASSGYRLTWTRLFETADFPNPGDIDLTVILGGPMSVNDEGMFPWLVQEKRYIRDMIAAGKPVLGICLGAQLIASAMGAKIYPNPEKEIGWFPIHGAVSGDRQVFEFPSSATVFHWHGETFDLPEGAIRLASSEGCLNQGFQLGKTAIGLQFHLETTPESALEILSHCRDELVPARYIQTETEILAAKPARYTEIHRLMGHVLDYLKTGGA